MFVEVKEGVWYWSLCTEVFDVWLYRPLSRQKLEAELKAKNQLLETAKQQLHTRLTGAQVRMEMG